jgi:hypothetical protein
MLVQRSASPWRQSTYPIGEIWRFVEAQRGMRPHISASILASSLHLLQLRLRQKNGYRAMPIVPLSMAGVLSGPNDPPWRASSPATEDGCSENSRGNPKCCRRDAVVPRASGRIVASRCVHRITDHGPAESGKCSPKSQAFQLQSRPALQNRLLADAPKMPSCQHLPHSSQTTQMRHQDRQVPAVKIILRQRTRYPALG